MLAVRRRIVAGVIIVLGATLAACGSGDSLTGKTWQWNSWTSVTPQEKEDVPDPSRYTVEFLGDGTLQAKADCNTVSGTYTSSTSGGLKILLGPSTRADCGPDSLSEVFIERLGLATSYTFFRSEMTINQADLGTMTFK
jgi:heat shock protein HslJ